MINITLHYILQENDKNELQQETIKLKYF